MRLTRSERGQVDAAILATLGRSPRGRGPSGARRWMTAYQILSLMARQSREMLQRRYGPSGQGARWFFGAASAVATACRRLSRSRGHVVAIDYLDTRRIEITITGQPAPAVPSYSPCGIYRLR